MQASSSADAGRRAARLLARAEARLARSAEAAERRAQSVAEVQSCLVDSPVKDMNHWPSAMLMPDNYLAAVEWAPA